jgi:GGDEF domain-containing protein
MILALTKDDAEKLIEDLTFDAAQGMYRRAAFERRLVGNGRFTFVVVLDGDDFHTLNHRHGMAAVDAKVRAAIDSLTRGRSDLAIKWAGDEWAVILADCQSLENAKAVADRLSGAFHAHGIGVTWVVRRVEGAQDHQAACAAITAGLDDVMALKAARDRQPFRRLCRAFAALFPELGRR